MTIKTACSKNSNTASAINDVISQLNHSKYDLIFFFASSHYDLNKLSSLLSNAYPNTEIVGTTTVGEISSNGITDRSISVFALSDSSLKCETILIEDVSRAPILSRNEIIKAIEKVGLSTKSERQQNGFIFTLIDGLSLSEEKVLAVINSVFEKENTIPVVGGSSGCSNGESIYVSANGKAYKNAGVILVASLRTKVHVYKENAFKPMNITGIVTKADLQKRIVYEIDNMKAADFYAKSLNVKVSDLDKCQVDHPFLRMTGHDARVASAFSVNADKSITFYCQVPVNTVLSIGEAIPFNVVAKETLKAMKQNKVSGAIFINCIIRKLQMMDQHIEKTLFNIYDFPISGFCSFGEQLNRTHYNQTLTILYFGGE